LKYVDEYRDPKIAKKLLNAIEKITTQPWNIMEVCGGQTHSIIKHGIDQLLPDYINLIHGPGCPVCVTPLHSIDRALEIAKQKNVIFCSFGDMLRVPGSLQDLLSLKALGADIRIVYSPLDALKLAQEKPENEAGSRYFCESLFWASQPKQSMAIFLLDLNVSNNGENHC
jgi:hydrogenase expression/formation protein HypD